MAASVPPALKLVLPLAASAAWAYVVFVYSTDPSPPGVSDNAGRLDFLPRPDLFVHFAMYGLLSLLLILAVLPVRLFRPFTLALRAGLPVVVAGVYGIALELVQSTIPERSGSVDDAVADILGAITAVVFVYVVRRVLHIGRPHSLL